MKNKLVIFFTLLFLGLTWLLFSVSGYEFPNKKKHAEIPFFPATTNKSFVNHQIDSVFVQSYQELKKSNLLLINYDKNENVDESFSLTIVTKSFKPIFYLKSTDYLYSSLNDSLNTLFIIKEKDNLKEGFAFNLNTRKSMVINPINEKDFNLIRPNLKVAKHFTSNGGETESVFLIDDQAKIYFVNGKKADEISKIISLKEKYNFDFSAWMIFNGDSTIQTKHIQIFDKVVVGNEFKRLFVVGTPSSNGSTGGPSIHKDKGWFYKSRYYFFNVKIGNELTQFKTDLFYDSFTYFDELTDPKTANDTLLYYADNRFYQLYKK